MPFHRREASDVAGPGPSVAIPEGSRPGRQDLWLIGGLFLAAMVVRLPYLWQIPRFTDELQEGLWALAIYRGDILPLTAVDSYYGPLWSYLLAAVFTLGGPTELLPRLTATVLASLSVGLTYLVGRDMAGRKAGLIAAAMLLTSAGHVVINSHTARSNSITPLLTTLMVWALYRATRSGWGGYLAVAGFVLGVALQTHLSVIVFVPGLALGILLMRPRLLMSRWLPLAGAACAAGYANMILYNLQTGFWSVTHAMALQRGYTGGQSADPATYQENLSALLLSLSRLLTGNIDTGDSLLRIPYVVLALLGLVVLARRGNLLLLGFCLSGILVFPFVNPRYGPILSGRYLIPLLPFGYLGIAVGLLWLAAQVRARRLWLPHPARVGVALAVVLMPLVHLGIYYQQVLDGERINQPLFALVRTLDNSQQGDERILLDEGLGQENLTAGGTDLKALRFLLEAKEIPYEIAKLNANALQEQVGETTDVLAIMDVKKSDAVERKLALAPEGQPVSSASGSSHRYRVYRIGPGNSAEETPRSREPGT